MLSLQPSNIYPQLLTIEAAHTGNRETIYQAAMLDPHTAAQLSTDEIVSLCDELIEAHGRFDVPTGIKIARELEQFKPMFFEEPTPPDNLEALKAGIPNLLRHVSNIKNVYKLPSVVAVNRFPTDTDAEINLVIEKCKALGVNVVLSTVWAEGGKGGMALAEEVVRLCEQPNDFSFRYELEGTIEEKIEAIVRRVYRGDAVNFTPAAKKEIAKLASLGYDKMPVCMAKTQYSFSDDMTKLGAPEGFTVTVRNVKVSAGAGFIVALTGDIMTMPGLPKAPAALKIDVDEDGKISGLF